MLNRDLRVTQRKCTRIGIYYQKNECLVIGEYTYKAILRCVVKMLGTIHKSSQQSKGAESTIKNTLKTKNIENVQTLNKGLFLYYVRVLLAFSRPPTHPCKE